MVTQNNEPVEAAEGPAPEPVEAVESQNPIIAEVERLNTTPDIDISTEEEAPPAPPVAGPVAEPGPQVPEQAPVTPAEVAPRVEQMSPDQLATLRQQAGELEQLKQKAAIQQETQRYRQQLESQGYDEDQAQQGAQQYMQSRQAQQGLMQKADEYGQHLLGKMAASEHFAQKYSLQMADLSTLRQAETPEIMEELAKRLAGDRKMRAELEQLRKAQVPPQQFDNSQGEPDVASNESGWLDRYNAGDRSANATAAARRAAGLE
jgi:hypothetical protein